MRSFNVIVQIVCLVGLAFFIGMSDLKAQQPPPNQNLLMVDANQRVIGHVVKRMSAGDRAQVMLDLPGLEDMFLVNVYRYRIDHITHPFVFFQSRDCSGSAYLSASNGDNDDIPVSAIAGVNQTLYMSDSSASVLRTIASKLSGNGCEEVTMDIESLDAILVTDLGLEYLPPYTIE
jgi:hypothetical protein